MIDNAGSGYVGAPAVKILDGGLPSTATAYAIVGTDPAIPATFGKVTSVVITNPGVIVGTPTVSLVGGGGTGAAVSVASTGPNTSGGLTKTGSGQLTLTGNSTYTGLTSVSAGTLVVAGAATLTATSGLSVSSGAGFSFLPTVPATALTLGAGSTLSLANNSTISTTFESSIAVAGAATNSGSVNIALSGAFTSGNTYTVLTAAGGLDSSTYKVLNPSSFTYTTNATPTAVTITPITATPLAAAYWIGGFSGLPGVWSASARARRLNLRLRLCQRELRAVLGGAELPLELLGHGAALRLPRRPELFECSFMLPGGSFALGLPVCFQGLPLPLLLLPLLFLLLPLLLLLLDHMLDPRSERCLTFGCHFCQCRDCRLMLGCHRCQCRLML